MRGRAQAVLQRGGKTSSGRGSTRRIQRSALNVKVGLGACVTVLGVRGPYTNNPGCIKSGQNGSGTLKVYEPEPG